MDVFLSTPSARRATAQASRCHIPGKISIHALREEGDLQAAIILSRLSRFLSTPSARRATRGTGERAGRNIFLSTPSARRATPPAAAPVLSMSDFYPRPPRGGRLPLFFKPVSLYIFLSTPSARRATFHLNVFRKCFFPFLSTPSARRATMCHTPLLQSIGISIHALREEGDKGLTRLREGK